MDQKLSRNLSDRQLPALASLLHSLGIDTGSFGQVSLDGDELLIRSQHRLVDAVGTAQLLIGAAASQIWHTRTGKITDIAVDTIDALHSLHPSHYLWQGGEWFEVGAEHMQVNGFHPTSDGRQVVLWAGPPYQKLLNGYLNFFDCGNNRRSIDAATARYTATELESALSELGLPACQAFTPQEWRAHPQGKALCTTPVIEIEKIADGDPVPFQSSASGVLDGIRVLDFAHVLAGPHSTQTLAEFGAEVLHISSPTRRDTLAQHLSVDMGKYCAYLNLAHAQQLQRMHDLAAQADVFACSYRPGVTRRFGLTPEELAGRSRKGIVVTSVNAYGHSGPWAERAGFDPHGQAASGFSATEGGGTQTPKFSPVFYLNDLLTGYFAAAGMLVALKRRATEGGSWHVKVSLTRSAMWVQDLGLLDHASIAALPATDTYPCRTTTSATAFGEVKTLANPLRFSSLPLSHNERLVPYGADRPQWQPA
ncbi:CoA transferase [Paraburkholderia susongensis]|uniref:CoA-transferase family III n=1 Tax=Paraburkholderia susongensis TaxID=1515439 RepID=A0A1X7M5C2_9BURK|nr:CoA transferase [Paraburkholderia susongensis]SMG60723.1 CoA-transferase family III [Paraburkholderia susongensis]